MRCVSEITGGLGNQLFCYAAGYAAAKRNDAAFSIDVSALDHDGFGRVYMLDNFSLSSSVASLSRKNIVHKIIRRLFLGMYFHVKNQEDLNNCNSRNIFLTGNWHEQNYRIFHQYRAALQQEFTYRGKLSANHQTLQEELAPYHTVAIHLRYGDYVQIGCCMDPTFYSKAIRILDKKLATAEKPISLVIFSEDIDTARTIIDAADDRYHKIYITRECGLADMEEFLLMQSCDDHIISNSTFSWWAAYLHGAGVTVAPIIRNWIKNEWEEDYFPEEWITVETKLMNK